MTIENWPSCVDNATDWAYAIRRSEKWWQQGIHYKSASTVDWTYGTKGKKPLFAQNFIFKVYSGV